MPSVRSMMSCRIPCREELIASDPVDHRIHFAPHQPIEGEGGDMRLSNPRRLELRPEGY
jgi:hypothetical protein